MLGVQQLLLGGALVYILWGHTYIVTALGVVALVVGALIVYVWKIKARETLTSAFAHASFRTGIKTWTSASYTASPPRRRASRIHFQPRYHNEGVFGAVTQVR